MALAYGRRPPKNAPALRLRNVLTAEALAPGVPAHPATEDYLATLRDWQVLGNDKVGDCNAVTWANTRRLVTATLSKEYYPTQDQVWEFYRTQNPGFDPNGSAQTNGPGSASDRGMEVQTGLEYLHGQGGPDGVKAVAFAKVDPTDMAEVDAALAIFGSLWLGITVLDVNQQQFTAGQPWTDVHGAHIDGGHAVVAGGYTPNVRFITWGTETQFDPSFWNGEVRRLLFFKTRLVEEAWVVIWPEHLGSREFLAGVNLGQLQADYQQLTGSVLQIG
jgi:hypothetical protein